MLRGSAVGVLGSPGAAQGALSLSPAGTCCPPRLPHAWSQQELICGEADLEAA